MNKILFKALQYKGTPLYAICSRHRCPTFNFISLGNHEFDYGFNEFYSSESVIEMHDKFTWANVVSEIGLFRSTSEARKAGWNIPIENGYTEAVFFGRYGSPLFVFILK